MRSRVLSSLLKTRRLLRECLNVRANSALTYCKLQQSKYFSTNNHQVLNNKKNTSENESSNLSKTVGTQHTVFRESDAEIIFDVDEEQDRIVLEELEKEQYKVDPYANLNLERGVTGVFDIEDLVNVLRHEDAQEIFVATVPKEYNYVDYMVVVTGKSQRHVHALAEFIRKIYKLKRHQSDPIPRLEGKDSKNWVALDLGNIAVHVFSRDCRTMYDLETLWAVGSEFDDLANKPVEDTVLQQFNSILRDLQPADASDSMKTEHQK